MQSFAGNFGALEVAQRQYDLSCEVQAYLKAYPNAAVINLGCGLDTTFGRVDNGLCHGYNLDLLAAMADRFPGAVIAFDACNERGLKMMLKTWVKEAGITDVGAFFSVRDAKAELAGWSDRFASVTSRGYMKGYRDLGKAIPWLYRRMCSLCDGLSACRSLGSHSQNSFLQSMSGSLLG